MSSHPHGLWIAVGTGSTSKFSYPIRVINLPPGAPLGRDAADVVPASQAATDNEVAASIKQKIGSEATGEQD